MAKVSSEAPYIDPDEPFKNDRIGRKRDAEVLTSYISLIEAPYVLALNSAWGTGKTTFIKMWKQYLANEGYHCLYYNAWESDFNDDALVSLIGEIDLGIKELGIDGSKGFRLKTKMDKWKKAGLSLAKRTIPAGVKLATLGGLDLEQEYESIVSDVTNNMAKDSIEHYENNKSVMQEFKKRLTDIVTEFSDDKPFVIFIDELDRCRPNFAIEVLEKAKHLFSVSGVVFVISVDKEQLGHSIKSIYGVDMNVTGYLSRFIDIEYRLPPKRNLGIVMALLGKYKIREVIDKTLKKKGIDHRLVRQNVAEEYERKFWRVLSVFSFPLRIEEQCIARFGLMYAGLDVDGISYAHLGGMDVFLIALKVANSELYYRYLHKNISYEEVIEYMASLDGGYDFLMSGSGIGLEAHLRVARVSENNIDKIIDDFSRELGDAKMAEKHHAPHPILTDGYGVKREERVLEIMKKCQENGSHGYLNHIQQKIESVDPFYL